MPLLGAVLFRGVANVPVNLVSILKVTGHVKHFNQARPGVHNGAAEMLQSGGFGSQGGTKW